MTHFFKEKALSLAPVKTDRQTDRQTDRHAHTSLSHAHRNTRLLKMKAIYAVCKDQGTASTHKQLPHSSHSPGKLIFFPSAVSLTCIVHLHYSYQVHLYTSL